MSSGRSLVSKEDGVQSCPVLRSRGPRWGRAWIATVGGGRLVAMMRQSVNRRGLVLN